MTKNVINLIDQMEELIRVLKAPKVPPSKSLWDAKACASYLGVTKKYFLYNISCTRSFPRARNVCGTERSHGYRWVAGEVMSWAESKKIA